MYMNDGNLRYAIQRCCCCIKKLNCYKKRLLLPLLPGDRWEGELFCLRRKIAAGRNGQNSARSIESSSIVC